jgi:peroxiredoxin
LHVCPASEHLSEICGALEHALGIEAGDFDLVKHKNRLLKLLKEAKHAVVVFYNASWTTPCKRRLKSAAGGARKVLHLPGKADWI